MSTLEAQVFDPNVWYHITEARVDSYNKTEFESSFQSGTNGEVGVVPANEQYWQLQPVGSKEGRYALRVNLFGSKMQLSACYYADETAESKTRPCLRDSDGTEAQMWDISDWGDETYQFVNVANGSDYVMDVYPRNPPFMSDRLETEAVPQPAQHWLMTSVSDVSDGAFSTTFTNIPSTAAATATTTSSTSTTSSAASVTSESSSSGLSTGAAAGIGIGAGLGVLALVVALLFFWRRRRHRAAADTPAEMGADEKAAPVYKSPPDSSAKYAHYSSVPPQELPAAVAELDSTPVQEVDSTPVQEADSRPVDSASTSPQTRRTTPLRSTPTSPQTRRTTPGL